MKSRIHNFKQLLLLVNIFFLFSSFVNAQEKTLSQKIEELKKEINHLNGYQKLRLLDSLCFITRDKIEFKYDSIIKATIDYAIDIDSFDIANRHAARLVWSYTNRLGRPNEGKAFFEDFDAKKLPVTNNALLARFYLNGGDSYYFSEEVEKAIDIYNIASEYASKEGDSILYGISKKYIADAYTRIGKLAAASKMLQEVEAIYLKTKDTIRLVNTKSSRADLYSMSGFYNEAKVERNEVVKLAKAINYESGIISALLNAAIDNSFTENKSEALHNLNSALDYAQNSVEVKDRYEPQILNKLLQEYSILDSLEKATQILKKIQANPERYTKGYFEDAYNKSLGYYYLAKKEYSKSLEYAKKHYDFQIKNRSVEQKKSAHTLLYKVYQQMGNSKSALYHYEQATVINDSLMAIKRSNALSYYQTLYETEKRDAKIARKESEIEILNHENRDKQRWIIFGGLSLLAIFTIIYLSRIRKFEHKKQKLQNKFSQNLINAQENERGRIARELHDSVGQKLMLLSKSMKYVGDENTKTLAKDTLEEVRSISRGLHPSNLERLGLTESIKVLVYNINATTDLFFSEDIENIDGTVSKNVELHVYRIIQETLSNIVRHSEAKAVKIKIKKPKGEIDITVSDNGKGFDFQTKYKDMSLGLKTLKERAKIIGAKLYFDSQDNNGTIMQLNIPI
ncbi:tetratricopeptide repeat-containing sensor histidine kinase [Winogradskyella haliclonae]|uniref:histidine kinase n=1 Tax=Winogradskyella haliclonae TaxID=2048558 RepID=A0ABQ2BVB4_9FLAO|nr:sensor histidine kinase [Winogradskyella haliclonae]GGI56417.1 hypothetical protein GCM10011444_07260 [Winogradskyella haliclonae]